MDLPSRSLSLPATLSTENTAVALDALGMERRRRRLSSRSVVSGNPDLKDNKPAVYRRLSSPLGKPIAAPKTKGTESKSKTAKRRIQAHCAGAWDWICQQYLNGDTYVADILDVLKDSLSWLCALFHLFAIQLGGLKFVASLVTTVIVLSLACHVFVQACTAWTTYLCQKPPLQMITMAISSSTAHSIPDFCNAPLLQPDIDAALIVEQVGQLDLLQGNVDAFRQVGVPVTYKIKELVRFAEEHQHELIQGESILQHAIQAASRGREVRRNVRDYQHRFQDMTLNCLRQLGHFSADVNATLNAARYRDPLTQSLLEAAAQAVPILFRFAASTRIAERFTALVITTHAETAARAREGTELLDMLRLLGEDLQLLRDVLKVEETKRGHMCADFDKFQQRWFGGHRPADAPAVCYQNPKKVGGNVQWLIDSVANLQLHLKPTVGKVEQLVDDLAGFETKLKEYFAPSGDARPRQVAGLHEISRQIEVFNQRLTRLEEAKERVREEWLRLGGPAKKTKTLGLQS